MLFMTPPKPLVHGTHRISAEDGVSGDNCFWLLERDRTATFDGERGARFGGVAVKSHRLTEADMCCAKTEFRRDIEV